MKQIEVDDEASCGQIKLAADCSENLPRYTGNQCYLHYVNNEVPWRVKRFGKIETAKLKAAVAKHEQKESGSKSQKRFTRTQHPFNVFKSTCDLSKRQDLDFLGRRGG